MLRAWATPGTGLPPLEQAPAPAAPYRAMVRLARPATDAGKATERTGGR
ncbi:hypothetical protein [Nonomuraea sp. CA-141351]